MIQIEPCLFQSIDDRYKCAFRRDASGEITHLFTNGNTAFERIVWYETAGFQQILLAASLLFFALITIVLQMVRKLRKMPRPAGVSGDPVRWFAQKTASTFFLYVMGLGIVMGGVIPRDELMLGFAHGMHWTAYIVQTIAFWGFSF